jgi:hypothetical protein
MGRKSMKLRRNKMPSSRFYEPMTVEELQAIQKKYSGNEDVWTLLWEIARLHSTVLAADQFVRSISKPGGSAQIQIYEKLVRRLDEEPSVLDTRKAQAEMLEPYTSRTPQRKR